MSALNDNHHSDIKHNWQENEVLQLFELPFNDLIFKAQTSLRQYFNPNNIQVSTLLSVKTGGCPENCKYCPQSAHYDTGLEKQGFMSIEEVAAKAQAAKEKGATRFCMGAAWRSLNDRDVPQICDMIETVKSLGLQSCVTLGMATKEQLDKLKLAGLDYYNHNIDTSEEFYGNIISTRDFQDRITTLENIQNAGLNSCSGGIVGMGETINDRAKMLITLANMKEHPTSVPINRLVQVKGTPLEGTKQIDDLDFIRMIAVARIMMPKSYIRLSAGRETMDKNMQALCFLAGANSVFYGEKLLTTANPDEHHDLQMFNELGLQIEQA